MSPQAWPPCTPRRTERAADHHRRRAIGGTIGAHLIRDGHDVLLCDADTGTSTPSTAAG
jgi:hypothetical protein